MAINCAVKLNTRAYSAGSTPPPSASVVVYNPNASEVVVTAIQLSAVKLGSTPQTLPMQAMVAPVGWGINTTVPAGGSITIGPMAVAFSSAAFVPSPPAPASAANPNNPQPSQPPSYIAQIHALVFASDGSINTAAPAGMTVSSSFSPTPTSQGGYLDFAAGTNLANFLMGVI